MNLPLIFKRMMTLEWKQVLQNLMRMTETVEGRMEIRMTLLELESNSSLVASEILWLLLLSICGIMLGTIKNACYVCTLYIIKHELCHLPMGE